MTSLTWNLKYSKILGFLSIHWRLWNVCRKSCSQPNQNTSILKDQTLRQCIWNKWFSGLGLAQDVSHNPVPVLPWQGFQLLWWAMLCSWPLLLASQGRHSFNGIVCPFCIWAVNALWGMYSECICLSWFFFQGLVLGIYSKDKDDDMPQFTSAGESFNKLVSGKLREMLNM